MCGLAGTFAFRRHRPDSDMVRAMAGAMAHRGPDGEGFYADETVAFGHRRLAIVGPGPSGAQPLSNEDGSIILIFNGEIYNYHTLKDELDRHHVFASRSDGEVVIHLYEQLGESCLDRLDGMFAFALYDRRRRRLFIARDRIGEKPLYYLVAPDAFIFSSELNAFRCVPNFEAKVWPEAVNAYFLYTQVPAPFSLFSGVRKLLPAHYMIIDGDGARDPQTYWTLDYTKKTPSSLPEAATKLRALLERAVEKTLLADTPVGLTLSGGLDSSIVAALMREKMSGAMATFTLGGGDGERPDPEFGRAARIAEMIGSEHREFVFDQGTFASFCDTVSALDDPIGIYDVTYNLRFNAFVSRHVKVCLTGNGADEVFGGYASYAAFQRRIAIPEAVLAHLPRRRAIIDLGLRRHLNARGRRNAKRLFTADFSAALGNHDVESYLAGYKALGRYDTIFDARLFFDLILFLNHSASLPDQTGMANSLELRSPYLDREVIEFAASLPASYRVPLGGHATKTKLVLKTAGRDVMPTDMAFAEKYGCGQFIDPFDLLRTSWRQDAEELLFYQVTFLRDIFCTRKIGALWRRVLGKRAGIDDHRLLMKILIFFAWCRGREMSL